MIYVEQMKNGHLIGFDNPPIIIGMNFVYDSDETRGFRTRDRAYTREQLPTCDIEVFETFELPPAIITMIFQ